MTELNICVPSAFSGLYDDARQTKVFYGGRGGAKSTACAEALIVQGMESPLRVLCAREVQKSIKLSVYSLIADKIAQYNLCYFYDVKSDSIVGKNGTEFFFVGLQSHTVDSLKSIERIDRCWVEEAHNVTDKSWEILLPSLFRAAGCQLWVTFNTRKTTDPTYIRFVQRAQNDPDILVKKVSWRDNPWFPEALDKQRLKLLADDPEAYAHVWEGEPDTRHNGSVYAKWVDKLFARGRVKSEIFDPNLCVHTAWDLGWSDTTAIIFFQQAGSETRVIDSYESFNEDVPHYCDVLKNRGYTYGTHYVPQDAANKLLAAGGRSIVERARDCGVMMSVIPETTHSNRIDAARAIMAYLWIDAKCTDLINALNNYQFKYSDDLGVFSKIPVHDWASHYSTAFELLARVAKEPVKQSVDKTNPVQYVGLPDNTIIGHFDVQQYFKKKQRERDGY